MKNLIKEWRDEADEPVAGLDPYSGQAVEAVNDTLRSCANSLEKALADNLVVDREKAEALLGTWYQVHNEDSLEEFVTKLRELLGLEEK